MNAFVLSVAYVLIWRLAVLACGLVAIVLGYHLFKIGLESKDGDLETELGKIKIKFSRIAPGTAFALFGAVIVGTLVSTSPSEIVIPREMMLPSLAVDAAAPRATVPLAAEAASGVPRVADVKLEMGAGGIVVRGGQ